MRLYENDTPIPHTVIIILLCESGILMFEHRVPLASYVSL